MPLFTIDGILMISISYFLIGFEKNVNAFFTTVVTCMLVEWSAASVGLMISAVSPTYAVAVSVSGPLLTVFSLTGGLYTNVGKMPHWISWIQYLSWFRFGYESLVVNQFRFKDQLECFPIDGTQCEKDGHEIVQNLWFDEENLYWNWLYMFVYIIIFHMIGYNGILLRTKFSR